MSVKEDAIRRRSPSAEDNQRYVREQLTERDPAMAKALGRVLAERDQHLRDCPQHQPARGGRSSR